MRGLAPVNPIDTDTATATDTDTTVADAVYSSFRSRLDTVSHADRLCKMVSLQTNDAACALVNKIQATRYKLQDTGKSI